MNTREIRDLLSWDETLFRDQSVLEDAYLPDAILCRDPQMRELALAARAGIRGRTPGCAVCTGLPGTGKTTTVRHLCAGLEEAGQRLIPAYINCQIDDSAAAVVARIHEGLRGEPPPKGRSLRANLTSVGHALTENRQSLLACLDDVNYLFHDHMLDTVLSTLLRACETCEGARVGVVAVTSDPAVDLWSHLRPRTASVFRAAVIPYPAYTGEETLILLRERVRAALWPGVMPEDLLRKIAYIASDQRDLRAGVSMCRQTSLRAEWEGRRRIDTEDLSAVLCASGLVTDLSPDAPPSPSCLVAETAGPYRAGDMHRRGKNGKIFL